MYATTNCPQPLKIDQDQALDHFKALGYEQGDKAYVRYIHPVSKKSIKAAKLDFNSANRYQAQGYDVYFVVNGGGDTDSCVTQCRAIFYEHDNLDKSIQLELWQNLGLPEPTIQVDTGGKSIHSYWVFDTPIATQHWREVETDLLEFSDGDRALKNPSRILRLAGSSYMKGDKPGTTQAAIVSNSGKRYSYEQLRAIIPIQQTPTPELQPIQQITQKTGSSIPTPTYQRYDDIQVPVPESVPLYNCLSKESRTLIESGVGADRNVNGAKLARDLIGSANYLRSLGQTFDGDEWQLFTDYGYRCPPGNGWGESEMQSIWKSAQSSNPSPSCKAEGVETCVRAWYWNHHIKPSRTKKGEKNKTPLSPKYDPDERLKLDLHSLLKESDPIKRLRRRSEICSHYRLRSNDVNEALKHLEGLTRTKESHCWSLGELFDLPRTGIDYLISGMLPVGETVLLVADPKSGKTLLAYDAAYAIATGEDTFLGETTRQGKVLIIQCDESRSTATGRLIKRGFRACDSDNVQFMDAFSISQLSLLEERLETFRPSLVIIDSLRRINAGREVSENSAEFTDTLYQLKELLTRYEAAGIVIHHSNKSKDAVGVGRVRGSSAISGAVWGVWQLDHIPKRDPHNKKRLIIDPKDPTRILSITARDIEGQRLLIELDPDRNQWNNLGEEGQAEEDKCDRAAQADLILNLLKPIAPVGLEARELNDKLELGRGIYSVLNRLLGKGIIGSRPSPTDKRRTVYYYPSSGQNPTQGVNLDPSKPINNKGDTPPPTPCVQDVIEYSETLNIPGLQRSITGRSQIDHKSITTKDDMAVRSTLNPVLVSSLEVDHNSATERGERGGRKFIRQCDRQKSFSAKRRTITTPRKFGSTNNQM